MMNRNLLLPVGHPSAVQQPAQFVLRVAEAEGLDPDADSASLFNSVLKAMSSTASKAAAAKPKYAIHASFASHTVSSCDANLVSRDKRCQGKTASRAVDAGGRVVWNEELVFLEWFPPLVRRIRLSLWVEREIGSAALLATRFLDLGRIPIAWDKT